MTRAQQYAEKYVDNMHFDPGYVAGFLDGVEWQKTAALKSVERRRTVWRKPPVKQRKVSTVRECRNCYHPKCRDVGFWLGTPCRKWKPRSGVIGRSKKEGSS